MPQTYGQLLKSQANEVFEIIRRAGLDPGEFEWGADYMRLFHRPSKFYITFSITFSRNQAQWFSATCSPGPSSAVETSPLRESWESLRRFVEVWAIVLARELATPDLWGMVEEQKALAKAADSSDNEAFTHAQLAFISKQVRELGEYIAATNQYNAEENRALHSKLDYLVGASKRMGKKDWINVCFGVLGILVSMMGMPPDAARGMFQMAGILFRTLLNQPPLLLP
jgi:hypothetical protein